MTAVLATSLADRDSAANIRNIEAKKTREFCKILLGAYTSHEMEKKK